MTHAPDTGTTDDELAQRIFASSPDGVIVVEDSGRVVIANRQAADLFACASVEELVGKSVEDLIPQPLRIVHTSHRARFQDQPRVRAMGAGLELSALRCDGTTFPVDIALSPIEVDGRQLVVASVRDASERRLAERELRQARERIATIEDRERIARDLHDTVIQDMFGAGLTLQGVLGRVTDDAAARQISETIRRLDESISTLRQIIFDLRRPPEGGEIGLSIRDVVGAANRELGFTPELTIHGDVEQLDSGTVSHLIPTLREGLANVIKHAGATEVEVRLTVGDRLRLHVIDDGVGMSEAEESGFGLSNMNERAASLEGMCSVHNHDGGGTELVWEVPLPSL